MAIPSSSTSLIHYDIPMIFGDSHKRGGGAGRAGAVSSGGRSSSLSLQIPVTEDILNSIICPRQFEQEGKKWIQFASSDPGTRLDVINLQELLDKKLLQYQARETGLCPIRESLYSEAFDELIRQITVNCAERGLLLLRVRDEIRMTLQAYHTLYESSVAFGMRKALHAEQETLDLQAAVRALQNQKEGLLSQVEELKEKCEMIEQKESERKLADEKKHDEEVALLRRTHQTLTSNLQTIINPGRK